MKSRLAKNIFSAAGQTIIQLVMLLVLYRYLIGRIGIDQLGIWSVVTATVSAARVSELGFSGSILRFVAAYRSHGDDLAAAESLQTAAISVGALLAIIIALGYPFLMFALQYVLPSEGLNEGRVILPYGLVSLWFTSVAGIWMNTLDACFQSGLRAGIMILGSLFFFLSALIGVELYGIVGLAAAQVAQGMILVVAGWVAIRRVMPSVPRLPNQWKFLRFKEMLGYGLNFQINSVVALLFEPATKMIIGHYGGLSSAGYFEMAQRMVVSVRALVVESNRVIVAVYADMTSYEIDAPDLYVRNIRNLLSLVIPVFAALIALFPAICELWVGSFELQFVIMGVWLSFAWFLNTVSAPAYFAYLGRGKLRWNTIAHIVMGATNIPAGLFLGNYFGWQGVLVAFAGALVIGSLIPVWAFHYEHRKNNIKLLSTQDLITAGVCFGLAVIVLTSYWVVIDDFHINKWTRITVATCFMGMVSITAIWFHPFRKQLMMMATSRSRDLGPIN